ncbi:TLDc domain-containing protein [Entamoeba marina]
MKKVDHIMNISCINNVTRLEQLNNSIESLIEWSGKPNYNVIFDSDIDGDGKSTLNCKLMNKRNLYFIHFDNENNIFGGYVNELINKTNIYVYDKKSFVFSLLRNGEVINKKYVIKPERAKCSFDLQSNYDFLYWFGYGNGKFDIIAPKIGHISKTACLTNSYEYNGEKQPLRNKTIGYVINRILVLEMV